MLLLASCGLIDSRIEWKHKKYELTWIDNPDEVSLSYRVNNHSTIPVIEPTVYSVGANDKYIVAKQHPKGDIKVTNYYIINLDSGGDQYAPDKGLIGPLSETEYRLIAKDNMFPQFSKTLDSLK